LFALAATMSWALWKRLMKACSLLTAGGAREMAAALRAA
jgi:hypothetical protein